MKKLIMSRKAGSAYGGKKSILFFILLLTIIFISGCNFSQPISKIEPSTNQAINLNQPEESTVSLLISTEDKLKYCDGAIMDSEGYKKTLTKEFEVSSLENNLSRAEFIRKSLVLAANQSGLNFPQAESENYIKIINDTAYVAPTEGWAGVSISLCSWQPFVEVNLLRFPEIKKVEWVNDLQKWGELK